MPPLTLTTMVLIHPYFSSLLWNMRQVAQGAIDLALQKFEKATTQAAPKVAAVKAASPKAVSKPKSPVPGFVATTNSGGSQLSPMAKSKFPLPPLSSVPLDLAADASSDEPQSKSEALVNFLAPYQKALSDWCVAQGGDEETWKLAVAGGAALVGAAGIWLLRRR